MKNRLSFFVITLLLASCSLTESENKQAINKVNENCSDIELPQINFSNSTDISSKETLPFNISVRGSIHPTQWTPGENATIQFNRFPKTVDEFLFFQKEIGERPEGAVLLELMAFEIYHHDRNAGERCLQENNVTNNIPDVLRILQDRYNPKYEDYYTPQLVASFLSGATPENAYRANQPFSIQVRTHKVNRYQDSEFLKGIVLYLEVYSSGYDTHWRAISVIKQKNDKFYKVVNCPALYTQCKSVSFKIEEQYLDIWEQ